MNGFYAPFYKPNNIEYYHGEIPEDVQLKVVRKNGKLIKSIIEKGIIPSEAVQLAAVKSDSWSIGRIKNPTKKAVELHNRLWS